MALNTTGTVPISDEEVAELRRLHALAAQVRGRTPPDDPRRDASVELTAHLAYLQAAGATYRELDAALNVRSGTVRARLKRHGYKATPPTVPRYGVPRRRRRATASG